MRASKHARIAASLLLMAGAAAADGEGKGTVSGNMVAALLHRNANPAARLRLQQYF